MSPADDNSLHLGVVYPIPPQPADEACTRWIDAGPISIGVEYRELDPDSLLATYEDNPQSMEELLKAGGGTFSDEGVSLHVKSTENGHEYLRFDVFEGEPHYHYIHRVADGEEISNHIIPFDVAAHGDMFEWAIRCLRERLPAMLTEVSAEEIVRDLDATRFSKAVDEAEALARGARENLRKVRSVVEGAGAS
ncbi:MAG: hypothetical protein AB8G23_02300 [Myxococcota bacterium]